MARNASVFEFQGSKMIVSAKGPNINKNFTMNTSFRPNLLSSTVNMPRNFEKQNSSASLASQKSIYNGRDTSPTASICSNLQPRNFHQPFYPRSYSQRSVYNREGSPMSMRSIDSTASRADMLIDVMETCNDDDWEKISHAYKRNLEFRRKAQKRRKMKMFMRSLQNRYEADGEEGSSSSISNDDCASTRTGYSQRYNPYYKVNDPQSLKSFDSQSEDTYRCNRDAYRGYARSEPQNPYQTGTNNNYHPANILPYQKQPQFGPTYFSQRNIYSQNESTLYSQNNKVYKNTLFSQRCMSGQTNMSSIQRNNFNGSLCSTKSMQNMTVMSQRDRFRGGFQFPSQKVNHSMLHEEPHEIRNQQFSNKNCSNKEKTKHRDHIDELSDENDDIFIDKIVKPKTVVKKTEKRKYESLGDIPNSTKKKRKMSSINDTAKMQILNKDVNENNEFEFLKPQFPIRKSAPAKPREKLISKSSGAPDLLSNIPEKENKDPQPAALGPERDVELEQYENTLLTNSDVSMRPSFMKRKLFTQTLDVTEKKNNSFESGTDSPQSSIYNVLTREKHKTRKLTTSQSLLSRDINQDDENLLDLIHKIVPPNQVNSTITANTRRPHNSRVSGTKNAIDDDKWDITSIISTCNNDSVSETYTDDEIFRVGNNDKKKSKVQEKPITKKVKTDDKPNKANDKPAKANEKPMKANDKLTKVNEKPIKANGKPIKANDKLIKANDKHIKATDKYKAEIKTAEIIVNPTYNKNGKELGTKNTMTAALKVATPTKVDPAKRVVLSRSRIDAFWDTDESDSEGAGARRTLQPLNRRDEAQLHIASPKKSSSEIISNTLSMKAKTNSPKLLSPIVALHDVLHKDAKKQFSKKVVNKPKNETKTLQKSNRITKSNNLDKTGQNRTITPRTRKQLNLSTMSETVTNSVIAKKDTSMNKKAPTKTTTHKKQNNENKATQKENIKPKPSSEMKKNGNKKQVDSQHHINISKKRKNSPKSQKIVKKDAISTKLLETTEHTEIDYCKILRSRIVDLSSSFNSDQFELTMSRTRKSRTPSKRISFNKSKHLLTNNNKIRSRATKT